MDQINMIGMGDIASSGWQRILERVLEQPIEIDFLEIGSPQSEKIKKKIDLTFKESSPDEIKTTFSLRTEELAEYKPIAEKVASPKQIPHYLLGSKITYNVNKIAWYADKVFQECCNSLGIEKPPEELVKLFRVTFSHVVRKHMLFHYKVERGSRLLPEDRYWEYRVKIYERSEAQTKGALEEALADAYAVTYVEDEIRALQPPVSVPISKESLVTGFRKMIRVAFINDKRPPGYREAKNFLLEFDNLKDASTLESIQNLLLYSAIMKGAANIDGIFRGLSWLYRELTFLETADLERWPLPPAPPYPTKNFLLFVENFRSDATLFLLLLLPPTEETFIDKEFYPKRLPIK